MASLQMYYMDSYMCAYIVTSCTPPHVLSPFRGGGIVYLSDPDSYAGWSFNTPGWASQARQVDR